MTESEYIVNICSNYGEISITELVFPFQNVRTLGGLVDFVFQNARILNECHSSKSKELIKNYDRWVQMGVLEKIYLDASDKLVKFNDSDSVEVAFKKYSSIFGDFSVENQVDIYLKFGLLGDFASQEHYDEFQNRLFDGSCISLRD